MRANINIVLYLVHSMNLHSQSANDVASINSNIGGSTVR